MRRISAQRSCFTIHGSNRNAFGNLAKGGKSRSLVQFEIPSWEVFQIRRTLASCGIDETTIFPDLEALGRAVTANWISRRESRPHDGVYVRIQRSGTHGVGLFAIRNIKKGTKIFSGDDTGMVWVDQKEIAGLPKEIKRLYEDFLCPLA